MRFGLDENIIDKMISIFEANPKVNEALIFGSRAKGNYRPDSDIDIAIKGFDISLDDILKISIAFEDKGITYKFDLIDYNSIKEPALNEHIDRVGIEFYSRWKGYKLGNVLEIKYGKDHKELKEGNIPIYGSGGIMRYGNKALYEKKSILIPRKGSLNNIFYKEEPFWTVDTMFWTIINEEIVYPKFLFYQLTIVDYTNLNVGSAVPSLTVPVIEAIDINLPPLSEQTAIATILSSLDDKIDLLHRQNKTLEQLAETLFRQMMSEPRFLGLKDDHDSNKNQENQVNQENQGSDNVEEAEESWELGTLEDLVVVKYGKDHQKIHDGKIPVFGSGGLMRKVNKSLYDLESVLIPRKGSLNNILYIDEPFWTVDTMFYTEMKKDNIAKFIYHFLKGLDLASMNVGSAVPSMTTEILNNLILRIPSDLVLKRFEETVSPIYKKKKSNQTQIRTLTQLRDTLLPKLMSGEIRLNLDFHDYQDSKDFFNTNNQGNQANPNNQGSDNNLGSDK